MKNKYWSLEIFSIVLNKINNADKLPKWETKTGHKLQEKINS